MADEYELTDDDAPNEDGTSREPQHNPLAEQYVLGAMMITRTGDEIDDVAAAVRPDHFYIPKHQVLFEAIMRLHNAGKPTDVISTTDELEKAGDLFRAGGAEYLHILTGIPSTAANAAYYAGLIAEDAVRRRLVEAGMRIQQMGYASEGEIADLIDTARAEVDGITTVRSNELHTLSEGLWEDLAAALEKKPEYQTTGWRALDHKISGFSRGELIVVGARPGVGKSVVLQNAAFHAARHGVVAYTSLEMKRDQMQVRLMSHFGDIPMRSLREHSLTDQDWLNYKRAEKAVRDAPVYVDVTSSATISSIRAHARAVAKRGDLVMVVVDYLQLVDGPDTGRNREREVAIVSREFKKLALDLNVIVVVAAQLNRGVPARNGVIAPPTLKDLRESGSIEQDADGVILLHRDVKKPHEIDFIVAKSRQTEVGTVTMRWQPAFARVLDPLPHYDEPLFDMGGMQ